MDDDAPPGVPEWVVTYGDMMSLLLTFFIMLVSMSEIVADQKYRAVLEALHSRLGFRTSMPAPPGPSFPLNSVMKRASDMKLGAFSDDKGRGGVRPQSVKGDEKRVVTMPEGQGRRIGSSIQFMNDKGDLLESALHDVEQYAVELRGKPNKIEIRSWISDEADATRDDRVATAFARARKVRETLIEFGVESERLRMAVVPIQPDADLIVAELSRYGVVTLAVLDAYVKDYRGTDDRD